LPKRILPLDGLRGLAILLTLLCHSPQLEGTAWADLTWVGVNLFFVLSGFLITGILLDSSDRPHYYRNFYARRALRIWPIYFAVLFAGVFLVPAFMPHMRGLFGFSPWWYLPLVQNYFPHSQIFPLLAPTWSLAIEEQFYLFWPLLIALIPNRNWLLGICIVGLFASPLARGLASQNLADPFTLSWYTPLRMDGLLFGAATALVLRLGRLNRWLMICTAVVGLGSFGFLAHVRQNFALLYSLVDVGFGGLVGLTLISTAKNGMLARIFSFVPLRYLGTVSYGLYLTHKFVFAAVARFHQFVGLPAWIQIGAQLSLAISVAAVSWHLFEKPILGMGTRFRQEAKALSTAPTL